MKAVLPLYNGENVGGGRERADEVLDLLKMRGLVAAEVVVVSKPTSGFFNER